MVLEPNSMSNFFRAIYVPLQYDWDIELVKQNNKPNQKRAGRSFLFTVSTMTCMTEGCKVRIVSLPTSIMTSTFVTS